MKAITGRFVELAKALNPLAQTQTATSDTAAEMRAELVPVALVPEPVRQLAAPPTGPARQGTWFHSSSIQQLGAQGGSVQVLGGVAAGLWRVTGSMCIAFTGTKNGNVTSRLNLDGSSLTINEGAHDLIRASLAVGITVVPIDVTLNIVEALIDNTGNARPTFQVILGPTVAGDDLAVTWSFQFSRLY